MYAGFFGEVFRGIWNGTEVAIKVFLEQDLTAENMEDFCNEISILRCNLFVALVAFDFLLLYHSNFEFFFSSFLLQSPSASKWYLSEPALIKLNFCLFF